MWPETRRAHRLRLENGDLVQSVCRPLQSLALTFNGRPTVTLLPGAPVLSDPVELKVPPLTHLAIILYFEQRAEVRTYHLEAAQTAYISSLGNFVNAEKMPIAETATSRYFLTAVRHQRYWMAGNLFDAAGRAGHCGEDHRGLSAINRPPREFWAVNPSLKTNSFRTVGRPYFT